VPASVHASRCQVQQPGQVRGDALVELLHVFSIALLAPVKTCAS
jgi:hypothetical protein